MCLAGASIIRCHVSMNDPQHTGLPLGPLARSESHPASSTLAPGMRPNLPHDGAIRSRARTITSWCFSAMACAASLVWVLTSSSHQDMSATPRLSLAASHEITPRLFVAGIGALLGAELAIMGMLYWLSCRNRPACRQDCSLATYDSVTGLPSRRLYLVLLGQALTRAAATKRAVAVLVASLQRFRPLPTSAAVPNMTLVVRVQAARIKGALQSPDVVARLDEHTFSVVVDNLESPDQAIPIAEKIQSTMSLPLLVEGQELLLSCRIGCAVAPQDGTDAESLLAAAARMLSSAQTGGSSIVFLSDPATHSAAFPHTSSSDAPSSDGQRSTLTVGR